MESFIAPAIIVAIIIFFIRAKSNNNQNNNTYTPPIKNNVSAYSTHSPSSSPKAYTHTNRNYKDNTDDEHCETINKISNSTISPNPLLNFSEKEIYWSIRSVLDKAGLFLYLQVNLGVLLNYEDCIGKDIGCKRVDFCIVDKSFTPIAVVEYNGSGHYTDRENTVKRDEIKELACRRAGIKFIIINSKSEVDWKIKDQLQEHLQTIN